MDKMIVNVTLDKEIGLYSVTYNGEPLLDCLSNEEVDALSIGELKRLFEEAANK